MAADLKPTTAAERVVLLDALRGFALLGILFVNMTWFTGYAVLSAPQRAALGSESIDNVVSWLIAVLVDSKFWSLFALLFGVGIAMQIRRAEARGLDVRPLLMRRLSSLALIGFLHAALLWFGDIISLYAVVGFALLLVRRVSDRAMIACAACLLALPIAQQGIWMAVNPEVDTSHGPSHLLPDFQFGNYADVLYANWAFLTKRWFLAVYEGRFFKLLAMFLLGYLAARWEVFQQPHRHRRLLTLVLGTGLLIGLPANLVLASWSPQEASLAQWLRGALETVGVPALALSYAAGFALMYARFYPQAANRPPSGLLMLFANVGRMTLTNYITQTVIGMLIFYGCGLGYWGYIGVSWSIPLILVIFVSQSIASSWWLIHFQNGPLEWLWRCMTYWKWLPLRRLADP